MNLHDKAIENLVEVAKEIGIADTFDVPEGFDADSAYRLIATGIIESYVKQPEDTRTIILMATCVHLLVENMLLYKKVYEQ